jgi:hypothetical protein
VHTKRMISKLEECPQLFIPTLQGVHSFEARASTSTSN